MANWVTHLMIADRVMGDIAKLDRRGFCVGNIAPDCNVENKDWTAFTPTREVTHWMSAERKVLSDCDRFYKAYIARRKKQIQSHEEYSFLLGYYSHLIADAEFQRFIRDEKRVKSTWNRIKSDPIMRERAKGYPENWDSVKQIMPASERMHEIFSMEAEYLRANSNSGYLTEIMPLKEFPDYIDYLPQGCIARKIAVMGYVPSIDETLQNPISISKEEFAVFVSNTASLVVDLIMEKGLPAFD